MYVSRPDQTDKLPNPTENTLLPAPVPAPPGGQDDGTLEDAAPSGPQGAAAGLPTVPGYRVTREIARGGMGAVYAARDETFHREVALKLILARVADADGIRRFVQEARVTGRLQHPGVPPVHALGTLPDGLPFLAMKLVDGRTLRELLRSRASPADELPRLLRVFEQLCQTVGYAHSMGVVHRDLKPANVMVGAFGEVQVMDWGLAKVLDEAPDPARLLRAAAEAGFRRDPDATEPPSGLTMAGTVVGTPAYMAPEQARGDVHAIGPRADVFSLGGVLCTILTGTPPFPGTDAASSLRLAAEGDVREALGRLGGCGADAELVALARACLSPAADARPADGKAVADALAAYRAGVEERLRAAELDRTRAAERRARARAQFALAAAVGLLLAVGGAFAWYSDHVAQEGRRRQAEFDADHARAEGERRLRDQAERDRAARDRQAVEALVGQAEDALRHGAPDRAATHLEQAERRAADGGDGHRDRLARCRADLELVRELDRIDNARWSPTSGGSDAMVAAWGAAFRKAGIPVGAVPADGAARRVRESPARERILSALDAWVPREPAPAGRVPLVAVLGAADPDPFRDAFRSALVRASGKDLAALLDSPEALTQPARFAATMGELSLGTPARRELILRTAHHQQPGNLSVLMGLAMLGTADRTPGSPDRVGWYLAALTVQPGNPMVWNNLGVALRDRGDVDGALAAYREAARLDPSDANAQVNVGVELLIRGDLDGAAAALRQCLRVDPTYLRAQYHLGIALRRKRDLGGAAAALRECLRLSPDYAEAYYELAAVMIEKGDRVAAVPPLREVVRLNPTRAEVHHNLGILYREAGDAEGSLRAIRAAATHDPANAEYQNNLGAALNNAGDRDGAIAAFREAARLAPKSFLYHYNLGLVLIDRQSWADAAAPFRAALAIDPASVPARNRLALSLMFTGDPAGAVAEYDESLRRQPGNPEAFANRETAVRLRTAKAEREGRVAPPPRAKGG